MHDVVCLSWQVDTLFKQVDADGSGSIEFDEFKVMMLSINPDQKTQQVTTYLSSVPLDSFAYFLAENGGGGDRHEQAIGLKDQRARGRDARQPVSQGRPP